MPKKTFFDKTWLKDPAYKDYLKVGSPNTTFKCKVCKEKVCHVSHKSLGKIFQIGVEQAKVPCEAWPVAILQRRVRS